MKDTDEKTFIDSLNVLCWQYYISNDKPETLEAPDPRTIDRISIFLVNNKEV